MNSIGRMTFGKSELWDRIYENDQIKKPWLYNEIPVRLLNEFCDYIVPSKDAFLLDYGCGNGRHLPYFKANGVSNLVGVDISNKALELCNLESVVLVNSESPTIFDSNYFDAIFCWGVIHHIPKLFWRDIIEQFKRILKEDGVLLIGGHSVKDAAFIGGERLSPFTNEKTFAINGDLSAIVKDYFEIIRDGFFDFTEAYTAEPKCFKYYLLK
ncbi:MAG: class I SAM-dependent methyltransferase [Marinifilaceae bacterium]